MKQYREKQANIYESFRQQMTEENLLSQSNVTGTDAGFLLVLKYPTEITDAFGKLSSSINLTIPSIEYGAHNIHTTLLTGPKVDPEASEEETKEQYQNLKYWFEQQGQAIADMYLKDIRIQFTEYLYNSNTLIAASEANDPFWQMAETLMTAANLMGQPLKMPWAGHATLARFLADGKELSKLGTLIKCAPALPEATPTGLELVRFECDKRGFRFMDI